MHLNSSWIGLDPDHFPAFQETNVSAFDDTGKVVPAMAVLRKTFELDEIPEQLTAYFSGDCKYRLFLNGRFIDDGPVEVGGDYDNATPPDWWFYDTREISHLCRPGKNVLAAELLNAPEAQTDYSTGHTGFTLELVLGKKTILHSDSSWRTALNPAYRGPAVYDAAVSPGDYRSVDFDDSDWVPAMPLPKSVSRRWRLRKLDLPPLAETLMLPVELMLPFAEYRKYLTNHDALLRDDDSFLAVAPGLPAVFFLRFETEAAGHFELDVESSGGASVMLEFQENPGQSCGKFTYFAAPGRHTHRLTRMYPAQWVQVTVSCGSFPAEAYAPVKLRRIALRKRNFPLPPTAPFRCSDENLMQIRETIDRTVRMCVMRMHWDSPVHQEGLGCTGDYMITALISYALYGESRVAAADISRTARLLEQKRGVMFHTSYSLLFAEMVRDCHLFTGDRAVLEDAYPAIRLVLERFAAYTGDTGLITRAPNYMFIDWVAAGRANYHHPPAERGIGPMTAFYFRALEIAAELAAHLGLESDRIEWSRRAARTAAAFRRYLWSEEKSCYLDGIPRLGTDSDGKWCPPDDGVTACSVHTNALALAYGLAEADKSGPLLKKIMTDPTLLQPQPYFMHFVFEALHRHGAFNDYGFTQMSRWTRLVEEHPAGLKEGWNDGDYSHAWGGTPAYQLTRSVLGVTPVEPGFRRIRFCPHFGNLAFAEGEIQTPQGMIQVKYDGREIRLRLPFGIAVEPGGDAERFPVKVERVR